MVRIGDSKPWKRSSRDAVDQMGHAIDVAEALAGGDGGAAGQAAGDQVVDLTRYHGGERLVQAVESLTGTSEGDECEPALRQGADLEVGVTEAWASSRARSALASSSDTSGTSQPMIAIR